MAVHQGRTAVYTLYDRNDTLIYVGISNLPQQRWKEHAAKQPWWPEVVTREIEWFDTRAEAERQEVRCIAARHPRHNHAPGMPERGKPESSGRRRPGWGASQELLDLFKRYEAESQTVAATRDEIEAQIIDAMRSGVAATRIAKFIPWRAPTIQAIGKKAGVPLLRAPTVRSIYAIDDEDVEPKAS